MKYDITSDLHLDFWVLDTHPKAKQRKMFSEMLEWLLPKEPSDVLLIAGDLGHNNAQNQIFLELLKTTYKNVLWVPGNHDLYLISKKANKKYGNSYTRLEEMVSFANDAGATYLDGTIVEIDGVKFGGSASWYDGQYAIKEWGFTLERVVKLWSEVMNDYHLINDNGRLDFYLKALVEKQKLSAIVPLCDVVVTHIQPEWEKMAFDMREPSSTFWHFDGYDLLTALGPGKTWVYGHTHDTRFYRSSSGVTMAANPLGYPREHGIESPKAQLIRRQFVTLEPTTAWD